MTTEAHWAQSAKMKRSHPHVFFTTVPNPGQQLFPRFQKLVTLATGLIWVIDEELPSTHLQLDLETEPHLPHLLATGLTWLIDEELPSTHLQLDLETEPHLPHLLHWQCNSGGVHWINPPSLPLHAWPVGWFH